MDPEAVTREVYLDARSTVDTHKQKASKRFLLFHDQIDALALELSEITGEYSDADEERRGRIGTRQSAINKDLAELQRRVIREAHLILSIVESLTDIPKKLGLIIERKEVGVYGTSEVIRRAIEKENDTGKQEEAIRALQIVEGFLSSGRPWSVFQEGIEI